MNIEKNGLARRASRLAALGDPVRLRIVDALALGDAAPVELQADLGISSSLLAHHLGILEAAGMVRRSRSQADRRRTYVSLQAGALDSLLPGTSPSAQRVVFVCTANSARSQLAAALWARASDVPAASAGTHPAPSIDPGAVRAAERHGVSLAATRPVRLEEVLAEGDLVVTVCDAAHEELGRRSDVHWSVPDPVPVGTAEAFDLAFEDIARRIEAFAPRLAGIA